MTPAHIESSEGKDEKGANIYNVLGSMLASSISDLNNQWDLIYYCMRNLVNGPGKQTVNMEQTTKYTETKHQRNRNSHKKRRQKGQRKKQKATNVTSVNLNSIKQTCGV